MGRGGDEKAPEAVTVEVIAIGGEKLKVARVGAAAVGIRECGGSV